MKNSVRLGTNQSEMIKCSRGRTRRTTRRDASTTITRLLTRVNCDSMSATLQLFRFPRRKRVTGTARVSRPQVCRRRDNSFGVSRIDRTTACSTRCTLDFTRQRERGSSAAFLTGTLRREPAASRLVTLAASAGRLARISIQCEPRGISIRVESRSWFHTQRAFFFFSLSLLPRPTRPLFPFFRNERRPRGSRPACHAPLIWVSRSVATANEIHRDRAIPASVFRVLDQLGRFASTDTLNDRSLSSSVNGNRSIVRWTGMRVFLSEIRV